MKKKTIRAVAIIVAILAVVTLAFTGCGKKKDKETTTAPQVTTTTVADSETEGGSEQTASVRHVTPSTRRQAAVNNVTETRAAVTETRRARPTGTTAASVIKDGEAGSAADDPGQTW